MKYINLVFILLFIASAFLQFNDEDPLFWITVYLSGAVLCTLSIFRKTNFLLFAIVLLTYLVYATILFFAPDGVWSWYHEHSAESITGSMSDKKPWIEATREFFGLLILALAVFLNLIIRKNNIKRS